MVTEAGAGAPTEGITGPPAPGGLAAVEWGKDSHRRSATVRFFGAAVLSVYGDWLSTVALVVVLFDLTRSPAGPAGYMLVRVAPRVFAPWLGGGLADRLTPRIVIVCTSITQALAIASLVLWHRAGLIWAIYVAVGIAQFAGAMGRPSSSAMLPSLVSEKNLARANALYGLLFSTSLFVAPAIGALLLVVVGADALFAIDAGTFVVSAWLVWTLSVRSSGERGSSIAMARPQANGIMRLALRHRDVRIVAAANFASGVIVTVTQALLVVAAHDRFGGAAAVGYLYSSVGLGGVLGGIIALRWVPGRRWTRFAIFLAVILEVAAIAGFSASGAVLLALLLLAVSAATGSSFDAWGLTAIQRRAPPGFMGRYNSILFASMYAGMLLGAIWALGTANFLHWDTAIECACAGSLVLLAGVWISGGSTDSLIQEKKNPEETEPPQGLVSER